MSLPNAIIDIICALVFFTISQSESVLGLAIRCRTRPEIFRVLLERALQVDGSADLCRHRPNKKSQVCFGCGPICSGSGRIGEFVSETQFDESMLYRPSASQFE